MWRVIFAAVTLIVLIVTMLLAADFIGKSCDKLEVMAEQVIILAEAGDENGATAAHIEYVKEFNKLEKILVIISNHADFNNASLSYNRIWEYTKAKQYYEAWAEYQSLNAALMSLQVAESLAIPNIM